MTRNGNGLTLHTDFLKVLWERVTAWLGPEEATGLFGRALDAALPDYPLLSEVVRLDGAGLAFDMAPEDADELEVLTLRSGLLAMTHGVQEEIMRLSGNMPWNRSADFKPPV
jgi:hypothetical protein